MLPRLVPEISPLYAFCDVVLGVGVRVVGVVVGIGDSRSWIVQIYMALEYISVSLEVIPAPEYV